MNCMEFSVIVTITPSEHLHWIPCNPFVAIKIAVTIVLCEQPFSETSQREFRTSRTELSKWGQGRIHSAIFGNFNPVPDFKTPVQKHIKWGNWAGRALSDVRGCARDALAFRFHMLSVSCSFWATNSQNNRLVRPHLGLTQTVWEVLDPPLEETELF